ncbi:prenyltransferase/squalene oxidase repeat-containing protein [Micromonospora sp. NPDC005710]|uniref:prenyltransferase/squalene oxidase repeat-containing protein n=1 Tax=Micromonospora sp. NPDC005710 TaxID=3157051 RepID=UPI0033DD7E35
MARISGAPLSAEQTTAVRKPDAPTTAASLIEAMLREPAGRMSPSIYETARLVSLAPWLTRHDERVEYLLRTQRTDGGWGPPEGYAMVPSLSATEAILTLLLRHPTDELISAADRGLQWLNRWMAAARPVPDTPAIDLIVPALTDTINEHLRRRDLPSGLRHWRANPRLPLPTGMNHTRLDAVQDLIEAGAPVPEKLLHALEVTGDLARNARGVLPPPSGVIGASPAATAAWLGTPGAGDQGRALSYLEAVVDRHDGLAPCATPVGLFERAWVIGSLTRAGIAVPASADLVASLTADLSPAGTPAGPGLPPDADTTSVTLYALAQLGTPMDPSCLWRYETETGFCTWPGEDGFSVTTNAHVLDAMHQHVITRPNVGPHYRDAVRRLVRAIQARQLPDGSWEDRWHASPYYATMCCCLALAEAAPSVAARSLTRAVRWVTATQRPNGSWGRWSGTAEETAYAMQVLATAGPGAATATVALDRGREYLEANVEGRRVAPALWHDKDLYFPEMIVNAAVLAAQHIASVRQRDPSAAGGLAACPA